MLVKVNLNRSSLSSWLMLLFTCSLLLTSFYTDFFQAPTQVNHEVGSYRSLLRPGQTLGTKEMILKNNLGTFHFQRLTTVSNTSWNMISPRQLPANSSLLDNILNDLGKVQIKNIHQNDPINVSNYSLDSSQLQITLIDSNGKESILKFGLINPLDNSTYVNLSDKNAIYQIDNITTTLNTLDLANFIDTRVFGFAPETITAIKILKRKNSGNQTSFLVTKTKDSWLGQKERKLNSKSVHQFLQQLTTIKSPLILDKMTTNLQKKLDQYLSKAAFEINITKQNKRKYSYTLSGLVHSLPGVKLEKWQHFIIKPSHRDFLYILPKNFLKTFQLSERQLKKFPVKNLFY